MTDYSYDDIHDKVEKVLSDLMTEPNPEGNRDVVELLAMIAITLKDIQVNQSGVYHHMVESLKVLKGIHYKLPE